MTLYRLSTVLGAGPASGTAYATGDLVEGLSYQVTVGGRWLVGYEQWILPTIQALTGYKYANWQIIGPSAAGPTPTTGSVLNAGTLTAGAWNSSMLAAPILLTPGYTTAATGTTYGAAYHSCAGQPAAAWGAFPETKSQFGSTETYGLGVTTGPLFGFASTFAGSIAAGGTGQWMPQMAFTSSISDPSVGMPTQNDTDAILWSGLPIISDTAPAGAQYGLMLNALFNAPGVGAQVGSYTLGTAFTLSQPCTLNAIRHWSPAGVTILPTRCGIWNASTMTEVAGTDNTSPAWSGAAGSGWVECAYSGVTLPAGNYVASTYTSNNTLGWFLAQTLWWGAGNAFPAGVAMGPITFTGSQYDHSGVWTFPATAAGVTEYDGVDVRVTAAAASGGTVAPVAFDDDTRRSVVKLKRLLIPQLVASGDGMRWAA